MNDPLEIPDLMTPEDAIRIGTALAELVMTDGWRMFEMIMRKREMDLGRFGLRDESKTRDYYLGRMDEALAVRQDIERLVQIAQQARAEMESTGRVQVRQRLGVGNLA